MASFGHTIGEARGRFGSSLNSVRRNPRTSVAALAFTTLTSMAVARLARHLAGRRNKATAGVPERRKAKFAKK